MIEAVVWRCSVKKVFLEISQNSQENTCARVSLLMKLQASGGCFFHFWPTFPIVSAPFSFLESKYFSNIFSEIVSYF